MDELDYDPDVQNPDLLKRISHCERELTHAQASLAAKEAEMRLARRQFLRTMELVERAQHGVQMEESYLIFLKKGIQY